MTDTPTTDGLGMTMAAIAGVVVVWLGLGDPVGPGAALALWLGMGFVAGAGLYSSVSRVVRAVRPSLPAWLPAVAGSLATVVPIVALTFSTSGTVHWVALGGSVALSRFGREPGRRLWRDLTIAVVATMGLMLAWS